jgi:hypothetical protein
MIRDQMSITNAHENEKLELYAEALPYLEPGSYSGFTLVVGRDSSGGR